MVLAALAVQRVLVWGLVLHLLRQVWQVWQVWQVLQVWQVWQVWGAGRGVFWAGAGDGGDAPAVAVCVGS